MKRDDAELATDGAYNEYSVSKYILFLIFLYILFYRTS